MAKAFKKSAQIHAGNNILILCVPFLVSGFFKALFQSSGRGGKGGRFAKQMQGKVEKLGWPSV